MLMAMDFFFDARWHVNCRRGTVKRCVHRAGTFPDPTSVSQLPDDGRASQQPARCISKTGMKTIFVATSYLLIQLYNAPHPVHRASRSAWTSRPHPSLTATRRYSNSNVRPAAHSCPAAANCMPFVGFWKSAATYGTLPTCLTTVPSHTHPSLHLTSPRPGIKRNDQHPSQHSPSRQQLESSSDLGHQRCDCP